MMQKAKASLKMNEQHIISIIIQTYRKVPLNAAKSVQRSPIILFVRIEQIEKNIPFWK